MDSPAGQADQYPVYTGVWTNWSRGQVKGSTLTLRRRDADLLIALTAFFIAFVSSRTWKILCFIFHRFYSTAAQQDTLYHQRQTILRNSSSPESGIQMLLQLLWANRRSKGRFRPLLPALVAILCQSIFIVVGGLSSRLSTVVGDEVLIKSLNCGYTQGSTDRHVYFRQLAYEASRVNSAANYAQECYTEENTTPGFLSCGRFVTKSVGKRMNTKASCPFKDHLCRSRHNNLHIDSGYIDTNTVLGLNAPPDEGMLFRNVLHCAPLTTTGFTSEMDTQLGNLTLYNYGSIIGAGDREYVHAARSLEYQYQVAKTNNIVVTYANHDLTVYFRTVANGKTYEQRSNFEPISDIAREDADIHLIFLSGNGVIFTEPSKDPWYYLNNISSPFNLSTDGRPEGMYVPKEPASPLACATQYQFCNTASRGTSRCGPLTGLHDAIAGAARFFNTTSTKLGGQSRGSDTAARFRYFTTIFPSLSPSEMFALLSQLGPTALSSQRDLSSGLQGNIASDQWQLDVSHWWDISMAIRQMKLLDIAYFPDGTDISVGRFNYTGPEFQKLCNNQKIRSTDYGSFSLFGLLFVLTGGLLVTWISYLLEPISRILHQKIGYNSYAHLEWVTNATLQLQRLAHEGVGLGTWRECTRTIPMTNPDELLGSLDVSDARHPILYCRKNCGFT
ncbi:hypothetical protein GGS20DRAFT_263862 [Poronia punctata]|nr:hypothetical protein GGS20DRAFT_263862 [Poronia punctata]